MEYGPFYISFWKMRKKIDRFITEPVYSYLVKRPWGWKIKWFSQYKGETNLIADHKDTKYGWKEYIRDLAKNVRGKKDGYKVSIKEVIEEIKDDVDKYFLKHKLLKDKRVIVQFEAMKKELEKEETEYEKEREIEEIVEILDRYDTKYPYMTFRVALFTYMHSDLYMLWYLVLENKIEEMKKEG